MPSTTTTTTSTTATTSADYEVIIVGAGVVGSALAAALGRDGRRVLLIERDWKEPDRIVGELLQPGGVMALQKLGLEGCLRGIDAIAVDGYAVFQGDREVHLPYPKRENCPAQGWSFHHGRFIMNLRHAAEKTENVTVVEGTVTSLITDASSDQVIGVTYTQKLDVPVDVYAPLTVVADGCFSKFRKQLIPKSPLQRSSFVGFILKDCDLPFRNHGHVVLAKPSPILLYQIGTHETRILVDVPGKLPSQANGELMAHMRDFVGPQLPKSVQRSFYEALKTERLRVMPNSFLPPSKGSQRGVITLGDAMNMRHPLTGGGMTVAFWDCVHVREMLAKIPDLSDTALVSRQLRTIHYKRKSLSSVVNILAMALYSLFSAGDDPYLQALQTACFGYFKLGGRCVSTPVGLLAGLIHSPMTLVCHFFAVAFYGTWLTVKSGPFWMIPMNFVKSIVVIYTACVVVLPLIFSEMF